MRRWGIIGTWVASFFISISSYAYTNQTWHFPRGFYVSGLVGASNLRIGDTDGYSTVNPSSNLSRESHHNTKARLGFSAGYTLMTLPLQFELEYTEQRDVKYQVNPVFQNSTGLTYSNFSGKLKNQVLMFNVDGNAYLAYNFIPYVLAGIGMSENRTSGSLMSSNSSVSANRTTRGIAWQVGAGIRYRVMSNLLLDLSYRHETLNSAKWGPFTQGQGVFIQAGDIDADEYMFSMTIYFGDQHYYPPQPSLVNDLSKEETTSPSLILDD